MSDKWDAPLADANPAPLWFQIADRLRVAIAQGDFAPGDVLPSETQLNNVFGVSRATSRASLNELETEGLIVRRSGKGSIVLRPRVDQPAEEMSGFSEDMRRRGLIPSYETREVGRFRADTEAAEAMEVRRNTFAYRSRRLLLADGKPMGLAVSWLPPRLFRTVSPPTAEELSGGSLYEWMQRHCGTTIRWARGYIEASAADAEMANDLMIGPGDPLLIARRQSFDTAHKPAEYAILSFRADRYRFHLEVSR